MAIDPRQQEQVSRIAAQQLGAAPEPAQAAPPQPAPPKDAPTTPQEEANEVAYPQTEGDRQAEDAVMYSIKFGDEERRLSPQQIAGTYDRYRDLNHKQALMKPVNALAERLMKRPRVAPSRLQSCWLHLLTPTPRTRRWDASERLLRALLKAEIKRAHRQTMPLK